MSLVANYSSSSDSEDSDIETKPQPSQRPTKRHLSSLLPAPKKSKTIQIEVPKFEDDEDTQQVEPKPVKSKVGLGLADLLPAPKNTRAPLNFTKPLIPTSVSKKGKAQEEATPPIEEPQQIEETEEEKLDEEEEYTPTKFTGSFFHIGSALKGEPVLKSQPKAVQPTPGPVYSVERPPAVEEPQYAAVDAYAYDPNAMYSTDPTAYYQYQQQYEADNVGNLDGGDDLERFVGKRLGGESNIQIKTVNQTDMLPSQEWRAQQALTATPKFNSGATMTASKMQMKKNNIMALAAHAINNQEKLDEMFAANKKTRREASNKYGF